MSQTYHLFPDLKSSDVEWERRLKFIEIQKQRNEKSRNDKKKRSEIIINLNF